MPIVADKSILINYKIWQEYLESYMSVAEFASLKKKSRHSIYYVLSFFSFSSSQHEKHISLYEEFIKSKMTLANFCKERGLNFINTKRHILPIYVNERLPKLLERRGMNFTKVPTDKNKNQNDNQKEMRIDMGDGVSVVISAQAKDEIVAKIIKLLRGL